MRFIKSQGRAPPRDRSPYAMNRLRRCVCQALHSSGPDGAAHPAAPAGRSRRRGRSADTTATGEHGQQRREHIVRGRQPVEHRNAGTGQDREADSPDSPASLRAQCCSPFRMQGVVMASSCDRAALRRLSTTFRYSQVRQLLTEPEVRHLLGQGCSCGCAAHTARRQPARSSR
jgi:hypothetical protein